MKSATCVPMPVGRGIGHKCGSVKDLRGMAAGGPGAGSITDSQYFGDLTTFLDSSQRFRSIPSFFILAWRVVGFMPRSRAAP